MLVLAFWLLRPYLSQSVAEKTILVHQWLIELPLPLIGPLRSKFDCHKSILLIAFYVVDSPASSDTFYFSRYHSSYASSFLLIIKFRKMYLYFLYAHFIIRVV